MPSSSNKSKKRKGRGWHGDEEAHRRAGRLGGLARAKNLAKNKNQ